LPWRESLYPKDDRYDVTALEIRTSDLNLFDKMRFLTVNDVDVRRPRSRSEVYSLIGYPQELAPPNHTHGQQGLFVLNALISDSSVGPRRYSGEYQFLLDNGPLLIRDHFGSESTTPSSAI
jgi:hypothetical protein